MKRFNLNATILVKLKEEGYQILADQWNRIVDFSPSLGRRSADYYKHLADINGYTKLQAWDFIQTFGPHTNLGRTAPYDTTILIDEKHLESEPITQ